MPTLKQFGSVSIRIYADDHSPPHFHIASTEFEVLIALDGLEVLGGRARPAQIAEALEWARRNKDKLAAEWARLNERG